MNRLRHRQPAAGAAAQSSPVRAFTGAFLVLALAVTASAEVMVDRLPNGVRVVVEPGPWNRIVSISVLANAGSKHDPPALRGLARVTNDLLAYSTATRTSDEVCRIAACEWIDFGTSITEDMAEVYASATAERFEDALDLVSSAVTEPSFTGEDVAAVQVATQREIERALDDPFERSYARLNELLFDGHPYAFPVRGTLEGVERITRSDVVAFHGERYVGHGVVVSIVGNVDPKEAVRLVRERFAGLPAGVPPPEITYPIERDQARTVELYKDVESGRVQIGYLAPPADDPDYPAVRVLAEVLGGGPASRLYSQLSPEGTGVAEVVGAFYTLRLEQGRLVAYATPTQIDLCVRLMKQVIEELLTEPVGADELERARNRIAGHFEMRGQRNLERARRHAWNELSGLGGDAHRRLVEAVLEVDVDDVRTVAERYLVDPVIIILRPGRSGRAGGI